MVPTQAGNLGVVREVGGNAWAGQLRFGDIETQSVPNVNAALAGFQFASAVTLQYYLARIDRQLGEIDKEIHGTRQDIRDERYGRIEAARKQVALPTPSYSCMRRWSVRHRIGGVQAFLLSSDGEHRSKIAHEDLDAIHQEMVAFLIRARAALRKLNLPKRALDE